MDLYSMCLKKSKYHSFEFAEEKVIEAEERDGTELYIYSCPYCFKYHLTKKKPKEKRKKRKAK